MKSLSRKLCQFYFCTVIQPSYGIRKRAIRKTRIQLPDQKLKFDSLADFFNMFIYNPNNDFQLRF